MSETPPENGFPEENTPSSEGGFPEDTPPIDIEKLRQKYETMNQMGLFPTPKMMSGEKAYVVSLNNSDQASILFDRLDPSPYQPRSFTEFTELTEEELLVLKALAEDIQKVGLLNPILVRLKLDENVGDSENFRFEVIAGHRRVTALKLNGIEKEIQVRIYVVSDLEAHHMAISDNIQRKQLTVVEELKALINLICQHLEEKAVEYSLEFPLNSSNSLESGSEDGSPENVSSAQKLSSFLHQILYLLDKQKKETLGEEETKRAHHTVRLVEEIFQNLPKPLNWLTFLKKDLSLMLNSDELILKKSSQLALNKSQIKAYQKIYSIAVETDQLEEFDQLKNIQEKSARELLLIAERFANKAKLSQTNPISSYSSNAMVHYLRRIGHTQSKIAEKLGLNVSTVNSKLQSNTFPLLIQQEHAQGKTSVEIAEMYQAPESLVLDILLEGKEELEKWQSIQWEIKTQARWNWIKGDLRFAEQENAEVQPQLIAHILYYFVPENALLLEAIAENSMVSMVCLILNRRCLSLSTPEKAQQYSSLFPHVWNDPLEWVEGWPTLPDAIYLKQNQYWPAHQLESFFELAHENSQAGAKFLFLYQERFAGQDREDNLDFFKVSHLLSATQWEIETWIDCSTGIYQPQKEEREQLIHERKIVGNRRILIVANKK